MTGPLNGRPAGIDHLLHRLRAQGFTFAVDRDAMNMVVALSAVRVHHGLIDIVELYGEDDALAMRIPGDEPDVMHPDTVLWRASGPASGVLGRLLDLADTTPAPPDGPPGGCWFPVEPGRSVWLTDDRRT